MEEKGKSRGISRREFLKDAGLVVGGAAVGAAITYPLVPKAGEVVEVIKEVEVTKYKCPYCGATSDTFDALKAHVTAQHPAEAIPEEVAKYVCPECRAESDTFAALKAHFTAEHPPEVVEPAFEPEETFIKNFGLCGSVRGGEFSEVDVKNGRMVRIRPLHYDKKYTKEEIGPFKFEARGKTFETPMKAMPGRFSYGYKKRVYSPNRIRYPLKRVDWEPEEGERNPQNRGKSKFKRISWDEAADIIASEIKRVQETYGPYAVFSAEAPHGEGKTVHGCHGVPELLLDKMGGFTHTSGSADSWEGWYWGAMHVWGTMAVGSMVPKNNLLSDCLENADMMIVNGDPETTYPGFGGHFASRFLQWFREAGIKLISICPDLNYTAAVHADKWIPVLPNTDAALNLGIIHTWMTEGTYDKDYVATHVVGFDKLEDYVLGREDGVPKTPAWASPRCGVPEWTIKALAREWAAKTTSAVQQWGGSMIRGPYPHEPARLWICLLGMQGLGKSGIHQFWGQNMISQVVKLDTSQASPTSRIVLPTKQLIPKLLIPSAILNPPVSSWGSTAMGVPVEDQFVKYTYPIPEEEGGTEIHMIWSDGPVHMPNWNYGYKYIEAYRSPKIEFIVTQSLWLENDCLFSDIILPIKTHLEVEDIMIANVRTAFEVIALQGKAIEPIGEAKSDYEAVLEVAKKLGLEAECTGGKTVEEWIKYGYETSGVADLISWEELNEKGFFIPPANPAWKKAPVGLIKFYQDPENSPLRTLSGKLEFYSERLAENFPDDEERGPLPKWVVGGPGLSHDESLWGERCKKYPLLIVSNHPRWRVHTEGDDVTWFREIPTCKVKGYDGYMYEPLWINPIDAAKRGIENGDIVKIYNDRGIVLGGAYVNERMIPGAVSQDHGARVDLITDWIDRGGSNNLICPEMGSSRNCLGIAGSGYLVEVEKLDPAEMEEWRKKYPEAFERDYDPACGIKFGAWVEGGM